MTAINDKDVIRASLPFRNPFVVEHLPLLSRAHRFAFRRRRRGLAKRAVGKPAKYVFGKILDSGIAGAGVVRIETPQGVKRARFNARNLQFSGLYLPEHKPYYETETSVLLDRLLGDGDVFFDIGANWGWFSLLIGSRPSFKGVIHAFEPYPPSYNDLVSMVEQSGLEGRIACHAEALGAGAGEVTMAIPDGMHSGLAKLGGTTGVKVRLERLDELGLPPPLAMKIDVEEHELEVLKGAAETLRTARPFIAIESGLSAARPRQTLEPLHYLNDAGYILFYMGWIKGDPEFVHYSPYEFIPDSSCQLALVPFLPVHRFQLGPLFNVVAVPAERIEEFKTRLLG